MTTTKAELMADLDARISAAKVSGFWTVAAKLSWLNQAGQRVCDWYRWASLELALETVTRDSREYYDYPPTPNEFKKDSIYQVDIEDEDYPANQAGRRRVNWNEFQKLKQLESDDLVYTDHNGFYFLSPIPENGKTMSVYGLRKWQELTADADESILPTEFDEAIVRIALATCFRKAKKYQEARAELVEVLDANVGLLANIKNQMQNEGPQGYGGEATSSRW